jgi:hypothetical protein
LQGRERRKTEGQKDGIGINEERNVVSQKGRNAGSSVLICASNGIKIVEVSSAKFSVF